MAWIFGFLIALLTVFIHLSRLESFGIPYLMPFVGADVNDYHDERDSIWRAPLKKWCEDPSMQNVGSGYVCGKIG